MLFVGLGSVSIMKNCDQGGRPREAFSSPKSEFFTIQTDPKPANNIFIFSCGKLACKWVCLRNFFIGLRAKQTVTSERASNSDTRQRKMYYRTDLFSTTRTLC